MTRFFRTAVMAACVLVAGCAARNEDLSDLPPMGNFLLGHIIVVDEEAEVGPLSRQAEPEQWKGALTDALDARLRGYQGDKFYHVAVAVEGYILAVPGVPLVASPKSALIVTAKVWDDEKGAPINDEAKQFTVFESVSPDTLLSSGLTRSKEEQIADLSRNAARAIHNWMLENIAWFGGDATTLPVLEGAVEAAPAAEPAPIELPEPTTDA